MASSAVRSWLNSPTGPKTTHFWGPVANWGLVGAALLDINKPADEISTNMTVVLAVYSTLFARFAWMVKPRNFLLLSCHVSNFTAQSYLLYRKFSAPPKAAGGGS